MSWAKDFKNKTKKQNTPSDNSDEKPVNDLLDDLINDGKAIKITDPEDAIKALKELANAVSEMALETDPDLLKEAEKAADETKTLAWELAKDKDVEHTKAVNNILAYAAVMAIRAHCSTCAKDMLQRIGRTVAEMPVDSIRNEAHRDHGIILGEPEREKKEEETKSDFVNEDKE